MSICYQGILWRTARNICTFFAWDRKAEMFYRATGSYKNLPRTWEVGTDLYHHLGNGRNPFTAIKMSLTTNWVLR